MLESVILFIEELSKFMGKCLRNLQELDRVTLKGSRKSGKRKCQIAREHYSVYNYVLINISLLLSKILFLFIPLPPPEESKEKLGEIEEAMFQYSRMDRDRKQFLEAVEYVKEQVYIPFMLGKSKC